MMVKKTKMICSKVTKIIDCDFCGKPILRESNLVKWPVLFKFFYLHLKCARKIAALQSDEVYDIVKWGCPFYFAIKRKASSKKSNRSKVSKHRKSNGK